jgi:predicted acylesterase/phospholipase RssA
MNTHEITEGSTDKLGLALSGGGFRASLFHIGVLARMAELDLLIPAALSFDSAGLGKLAPG